MIHRLLAAVFRNPRACNGRAVRPLRQPFVLSNAHAMLKAVSPLGHGIAVSLFCGPFVPSDRKPEFFQDAVGRRNIGHRAIITTNSNRAPLADILGLPV
jgi:hypothetical protein